MKNQQNTLSLIILILLILYFPFNNMTNIVQTTGFEPLTEQYHLDQNKHHVKHDKRN